MHAEEAQDDEDMNEANTSEQQKTKKAKLPTEIAVTRPSFSESDKAFARLVLSNIKNDAKVGWSRYEHMDQYAGELLHLHEGSLELEQRYESEGINHLPTGAVSNNGLVQHLRSGVFCEHNTFFIDDDSQKNPTTLTTAEIRVFSRLCLDTLMKEERYVVGTGQPGIGKTRGALAYSLQQLLWQYKTVIRAGFKNNQAFLFLPNPMSGKYEVWFTQAAQLESSLLCALPYQFDELIALIDPPESSNYSCRYGCKRLKFASNNKERHFEGFQKDMKLLIMKMPSSDSVQAMAPVLWTNKSNAKLADGLLQDLQTPQEKATEIANRCAIIGCIPRLVFNDDFVGLLLDIYQKAGSTVNGMTETTLASFYHGQLLIDSGYSASVMSKTFLLEPADDDRKHSKISLNPVSVFCASEKLKASLANLDGSNAFYVESICVMLLKGGNWHGVVHPARKEIQCGADWANTSLLIKGLGPKETGKLVRASNSYPILDFASTKFTWFSAKVGEVKPKICLSAFCMLMEFLDLATFSNGKLALKEGKNVQISLTMIRSNADKDYVFGKAQPERIYPGFDADQVDSVFKSVVTVGFLDTTVWSPVDVLDAQIARSKELFQLYLGVGCS